MKPDWSSVLADNNSNVMLTRSGLAIKTTPTLKASTTRSASETIKQNNNNTSSSSSSSRSSDSSEDGYKLTTRRTGKKNAIDYLSIVTRYQLLCRGSVGTTVEASEEEEDGEKDEVFVGSSDDVEPAKLQTAHDVFCALLNDFNPTEQLVEDDSTSSDLVIDETVSSPISLLKSALEQDETSTSQSDVHTPMNTPYSSRNRRKNYTPTRHNDHDFIHNDAKEVVRDSEKYVDGNSLAIYIPKKRDNSLHGNWIDTMSAWSSPMDSGYDSLTQHPTGVLPQLKTKEKDNFDSPLAKLLRLDDTEGENCINTFARRAISFGSPMSRAQTDALTFAFKFQPLNLSKSAPSTDLPYNRRIFFPTDLSGNDVMVDRDNQFGMTGKFGVNEFGSTRKFGKNQFGMPGKLGANQFETMEKFGENQFGTTGKFGDNQFEMAGRFSAMNFPPGMVLSQPLQAPSMLDMYVARQAADQAMGIQQKGNGSSLNVHQVGEATDLMRVQRAMMFHELTFGPNGQELHRCKACGKVFMVLPAFKTHILALHCQYARNQCAICGKHFSRSWLLKGHMRTHTGERPFKCSHNGCERAFADKSNLRSHMLIHSPDGKSHPCDKCGRSFAQKRYLHKHQLEVCRF